MTKTLLTYGMVFGLVAGGTLAHGYVSGRWSGDAARADLRMPEVPLVAGEWQGEEMKSGLADDKHLRNITRRYTRAKSGRTFTVSLTLGPAGLTAQHTPEYCYPSSGFQAVGSTQEFSAPGRSPGEGFRTAVYRKESMGGDAVRICWGWSNDGRWTAPKVPEFTFLRGASLYKLYVVSADADRPPADDAELQDFLGQLLPQLDAALFGGRS